MTILRLVFPIACLLLTTAISEAQNASVSVKAAKRTEIHVATKDREKLKDLSKSLNMVELTPIVNDDEEVQCLEISKINDSLVTEKLKAKVGDCLSEVTAFKKNATGKTESERLPLLSPRDAMLLYQKLVGATRIEVDLKRGKRTVPLAYVF